MELDLEAVRIDTALPIEQRAVPLITVTDDPYRFRVGEIRVAVRFQGEKELSVSLAQALSDG